MAPLKTITPGKGKINQDNLSIASAIQLDGWMTEDQLIWHADVVSQCQTVLEIGCFHGRTTKVLSGHCKGVVHVIDSWMDYEGHSGALTEADFRLNLADEIKNGKVIVHKGLSAIVDLTWVTFDYVFIDGDHSYVSTKNDINRFWPSVRDGGILAGHDLRHPGWPGVDKAVQEVIPDYQVAPSANNPSIWWINVKKT